MPRFNYNLRTTPPQSIQEELVLFDDLMAETVSLIVGTRLTASAKTQIGLPISKGGLGLPSAVTLAPAVFAASVYQSRDTQREIVGLDIITPRAGTTEALETVNNFLGAGNS